VVANEGLEKFREFVNIPENKLVQFGIKQESLFCNLLHFRYFPTTISTIKQGYLDCLGS
jgi:hypothetical protein